MQIHTSVPVRKWCVLIHYNPLSVIFQAETKKCLKITFSERKMWEFNLTLSDFQEKCGIQIEFINELYAVRLIELIEIKAKLEHSQIFNYLLTFNGESSPSTSGIIHFYADMRNGNNETFGQILALDFSNGTEPADDLTITSSYNINPEEELCP